MEHGGTIDKVIKNVNKTFKITLKEFFKASTYIIDVATPLWPSVGVKPNTWKSWGGLPNVQSSTAGPKTPRIGVFLVSLERS